MSSSRAPPLTAEAEPPMVARRCQCSRCSATLRAVLLVGGDDEVVAGVGDVGQAEDLHRRGRAGLLDLLALVVDERPDPAPRRAGDQRVADLEGAALHEHGGDRAAADVELGLEHDAPGPPVGVGPEVLELGDDEQVVEQLVDADVLAAPRSRQTIVSPPHASGTRPRSASWARTRSGSAFSRSILLMRDDDRHLGGPGVVDGLDGLGHHAVVGGDDQDDDVGGLGATGPHGGERLVARGVDEGDRACRPCSTW